MDGLHYLDQNNYLFKVTEISVQKQTLVNIHFFLNLSILYAWRNIPQLASSKYGSGQSLIKLQTLSCVIVVLAESLHMKVLEAFMDSLTGK